jgi:hypothetical protein
LIKLYTSWVKCLNASSIIISLYSMEFALMILGLDRTLVFGDSAVGGDAALREDCVTTMRQERVSAQPGIWTNKYPLA